MTTTLAPFGWTARQIQPASRVDIVNRLVNGAIRPAHGMVNATDPWRIAPAVGWCHDYALTKRWLLLELGFTPAQCRLCECIAPDGAHHLVLFVGNVVLDNLTDTIGPMRYPLVRIQSPADPDIWQDAL